jgi:hypothetical protein
MLSTVVSGQVRSAVVGYDDRPPTSEELKKLAGQLYPPPSPSSPLHECGVRPASKRPLFHDPLPSRRRNFRSSGLVRLNFLSAISPTKRRQGSSKRPPPTNTEYMRVPSGARQKSSSLCRDHRGSVGRLERRRFSVPCLNRRQRTLRAGPTRPTRYAIQRPPGENDGMRSSNAESRNASPRPAEPNAQTQTFPPTSIADGDKV